MNVPCKICEKRRGKRYCPGIAAEICPSCCGSERENTIDCPLDCPFLREARLHERPTHVQDDALPNADVKLTEKFVREHEPVILYLSFALRMAMEENKAVDSDASEAIESLIRTYRTLESGLIYETRSPNLYAAGLQDELKKSIDEMRMLTSKQGMETLRDTELLGCLVFLQHLVLLHANGRRKGRAFLDFLRTSFSGDAAGPGAADAMAAGAEAASTLSPEEPRILL